MHYHMAGCPPSGCQQSASAILGDDLKTVRTIDALRKAVRGWKAEGLRTAVVPTMGALHDGHLTLVREGLSHADRVIVTIFVNPKQFTPGEDLDRYPRDEKGDAKKLKGAGAHLIFAPAPETVYPPGFSTTVSLGGPAAARLEDKYRPQFFDGVATVVAKLFIQAECDVAMFGEKDYQQLKVVTRMARDLDIPTKVIGVETRREKDGLAMSSRNAYLSDSERAIAPKIYETLRTAVEQIRAQSETSRIQRNARRRLSRAGFKVDYFEIRHAETLSPDFKTGDPLRLLVAAWLGKTRLIDNIGL